MLFRIVAVVSCLVLLFVAIRLNEELVGSRQENEDLRGRLTELEKEVVANEASVAAFTKAQAELAALKGAQSTMNGKMELLKKQSARERERVVREAAKEHEALTAGFATALSRFGLSRKELETLLNDLPAEDRHDLLAQIAVPAVADPVEVEKPSPAGAEVVGPANEEPEKMPALVSQQEPAEGSGLVVAEEQPEEEPAREEPVKNDEPQLVTYTVQRGDNLTRIGRRFDVNVAELMKLNGIADANLLGIGQVLKIPQH